MRSTKKRGYALWKARMSSRLVRLMEAKGLTRSDIVRETGWPDGWVGRLLSGDTYPSHKARTVLACLLGVEYEALSRF
jgi:transcriptional regulator with XRE-family HTH domain